MNLKETIRNGTESNNLQKQFRLARHNIIVAKEQLFLPNQIYRNITKKINKIKHTAINENLSKYVNVLEAYNDLLATVAERHTISSNKLFELTSDKVIKKSYDAIKYMLPKSRIKSSVIGAVIFGSISALASFIISKSVKKAV